MVKTYLFRVILLLMFCVDSASAQHAGHSKPQLATSAAFAPGGALWVAGVHQGRLFIQKRTSQSGWEDRQFIDNGSEAVSTSGDNRPKIVFGPKDAVILTYTRPLDKPYTGEIRMLRSEDGGRSFFGPFTVHDDRQIITHRFESVLFDERGDLYTFWIDKRDAERVWAGNQGDMSSYEGAAIYYKVSPDGGKKFGPDLKVADYSCECCRIALVAEQGGGVASLWRHVYPGSVRDHAFARVDRDGVSGISRATEDSWVLKACPHHGPGLARATNGEFHAIWFGEKEGHQRTRYSRLRHDGSPKGRVIDVPDDRAEHADIAAHGKRIVIAWRSFDGERTRLRAWISDDEGRHFSLRELSSSNRENDHPRIAVQGARIAIVWRTEDDIQVHEIR